MVSRLNTDNKIVGVKQVKRALAAQDIKVLYIADDADEVLKKDILELCSKKVQIISIESMEELGNACGIDVNAAVAALL